MYKLMIVDDEIGVNKSLMSSEGWNQLGFELVYTAENGMEALNLAEENTPDVVITDIMMPFMDGLKLSDNLKRENHNIKIVILTGFGEFEYAQKAVKLQVEEYLLKPVQISELIEVMLRIKNQLDEEYAKKEDIQLLREHYIKSIPVLREKFLQKLIGGKVYKAEFFEKTKKYQIALNGDLFIVSVVSIDSCSSGSFSSMLSADDSEKEDLTIIALQNILHEVLERHCSVASFEYNKKLIAITSYKGCDMDAAKHSLLTMLEEVRRSTQKYLGYTITIGVGTVCSMYEDIRFSYEDAVAAMDYKVILGSNRIICIEDIENRNSQRISLTQTHEQELIRSIKTGNSEALQKIINELFDELKNDNLSLYDYQIYLMSIVVALLKVVQDTGISSVNLFDKGFDIMSSFKRFNNFDECKESFLKLCFGLISKIQTTRGITYRNLVGQAKSYISQNFADPAINIRRVASHLHISPGYLSNILKKELKITFLNYLMQIRMDNAKHMLSNTSMLIYEVGEKVGFDEPYYFSYCFKKYTGISPRQFRQQFDNTAVSGE